MREKGVLKKKISHSTKGSMPTPLVSLHRILLQRCIQNPVEHLWWKFLPKLLIAEIRYE